MSLNGLDDARVKEAYEAAVAEPGGWFLLKYASRDEVELLGRGNGGIVEIRNNIAQYEEKSPLYGFLRYRRRSVIIKYLPEDCSRLIQARVTVHFEAICDRFSPHDTTFEISSAKELKDTKLSAACSLHAASGSTSSSTSSLRRRRLMEIAEEEEEEERERKRQSVVNEEARPQSSAEHSATPVKLDADLANLPDASRFTNDLEPPNFTGVQRPSSPAVSIDEPSRRMSSQSSRTDLSPAPAYSYSKPRVKIGPRPSTDPAGRPRSSGGSAPRVSTVPAGIKSMSKGTRRARSNSQSQGEEAPAGPSQERAEFAFQPIEAVAESGQSGGVSAQPQATSATEEAPADASAGNKSDAPAVTQPPAKQNVMTPEKARLLKAMKLREQKMMGQQTTPDVASTDVPSAQEHPDLADEKRDTVADVDVPGPEGGPDKTDGKQEEAPKTPKPEAPIDLGTDHASLDTTLDSHPSSPAATSEIGGSTQASSLSDSTDETVLAKGERASNESEASQLEDDGQPESARHETPSSEEHVDGMVSASLPDRQSQATITAPNNEPTAPGDEKVEEPAVSNAVASDETVSVPASSSLPENKTANETAVEAVEESASSVKTPEVKPSDAQPAGDERTPLTQQIRIPVSKFSTHEARSPTSSASQGPPPSITAHASDVDSWRVKESAPPVPEKDTIVGAGNGDDVTEVNTKQRKPPERVRTNLDVQDNGKRHSVVSITDNDGFMDELQSATVQQATPVTVSKSPISPVFGVDQINKPASNPADNTAPAPKSLRTASNPVRSSFLGPGELAPSPARSASSGSTYLQRFSQQQQQQQSSSDLRPKSAKLGSSISQRIKALEKLSGGAPGGEQATTPKERPATTFFAVRKTSVREGSRPSSVAERASSISRGASPSPPASRDSSSPEATRHMGRGRSGSVVNRLSMFEGGMPPRGRPESVQVTARIVRDPNQPYPRGPEPKGSQTDYPPLDLKQSQLTVDVQNNADSQSPVNPANVVAARELADQAKQTLLERRLSKQSREGDRDNTATETSDGPRPRRRSSLSFVKEFIKDRTESIIGVKSPSTDTLSNPLSPAAAVSQVSVSSRHSSHTPSAQQSASAGRRLSIGSRRSSLDQNGPGVTSGAESEAEAKSNSGMEEKKSPSNSSGPTSPNKTSRASRFMRRLSNTLGTGRKNGAPSISPTVTEENAAEVEAASKGSTATSAAAQPSIIAFMGDVNVQFPDNLLWKRRSLCLDSQGFLILSAGQGTAMMPPASGKDKYGAMVKRYHMSDFKPPFAPDVELQELPNSVVLDLVDGSGLQIACEDRAGQMNVLRILQEAHRNFANY
ncbi:hypothetical protein VTH82DRAFT_1060 [Thermothelomyces myriococcoides]